MGHTIEFIAFKENNVGDNDEVKILLFIMIWMITLTRFQRQQTAKETVVNATDISQSAVISDHETPFLSLFGVDSVFHSIKEPLSPEMYRFSNSQFPSA